MLLWSQVINGEFCAICLSSTEGKRYLVFWPHFRMCTSTAVHLMQCFQAALVFHDVINTIIK